MEQEKTIMARVIKEDPSEKLYLVCLRGHNGNEDSWEIIEGRESTYEYIKTKLRSEDINMDDSFVLVETLTLNKRKSVYAFMKYMENYFHDPGFDIEDYIAGDAVDEQRIQNSEANNEEMFNVAGRLDMAMFMDEQLESKDI